jgi:hypothetical protein
MYENARIVFGPTDSASYEDIHYLRLIRIYFTSAIISSFLRPSL